jgi:hypothetical protein
MTKTKRFRFKAFLYYTAVLSLIIAIVMTVSHMLAEKNKTAKIANSKDEKASYSILVDTQEKRLYLLYNGKLMKRYICAVGKSSTPSPLGSYKITEKSKWGEGFGGYWLGINCPWGVYGIHGTTNPGSIGTSASHGCIRLFNSDAEELYNIVPYGTPVCISGGCYGAFGSGSRVIKPYMYGRDVQVVQQRLKELGYFKGYCSGYYNPSEMRGALHKFQKDNGLDVSDYIDKKTLSALGFIMME